MRNATRQGQHSLLTIAEIAKRFTLPESTARYYCKRFIDYLPHVGEGKRRRYRNEAIDVFAVIVEEMKKSKNALAVEATLEGRFQKQGALVAQPSSVVSSVAENAASSPPVDPARFMQLMEQQTEAMARIAGALEEMRARDKRIADLEQQLEEKNTTLSELRKEIGTVKVLQAESEKLHQQDLDQMRKWLGRIAQEQKEN